MILTDTIYFFTFFDRIIFISEIKCSSLFHKNAKSFIGFVGPTFKSLAAIFLTKME